MSVRFLIVTLVSALYAGAICACGAFAASSEPLPDGSAPLSPTGDAATVDGPVLGDAAPGADSALVDGPPTDGSKVTGRILFTTSQTFTGNLGGVAGADAVCKTAALMGGFPATRVFGAWLSTSASSAASRFTHDARPIKSTKNEDFAPGGWAEARERRALDGAARRRARPDREQQLQGLDGHIPGRHVCLSRNDELRRLVLTYGHWRDRRREPGRHRVDELRHDAVL